MRITQLDALPDEAVSHNAGIRKKVMLRSGAVPHLIQFSQARVPPGQVAGAHSHPDMYEIFFVEAGEGLMNVDGKAHPLSQGSCITIEPGETHELVNSGDQDLVLTYFCLA